MSALKDRLEADLTNAMKARETVKVAALRMALAAVRNEEVSGKQARELTDDEVLAVIRREVKKRREAAEVYASAGRTELADQEKAEEEVLSGYLPTQLSDEELTALVSQVLAELGLSGMSAMGQAMKAVVPRVAGRAEGARVAAEVRKQLSAG